jgi:hypothetical protein
MTMNVMLRGVNLNRECPEHLTVFSISSASPPTCRWTMAPSTWQALRP